MFFILAFTAMLGYSLQGALLARYYRSLDPLSVVAWRGISISVTMIPLLFMASPVAQAEIVAVLPLVLLSSFIMVVANWAVAKAFGFLSVGVTSTFCMSFMAVSACFIGVFVLGEVLSAYEVFWICAIVWGLLYMGLAGENKELSQIIPIKGILFCLLHGIVASIGFYLLTLSARLSSPLLVAYLWESAIGVFAAGLACSRWLKGRSGLLIPGRETLIKISLFSFPTVVATACYAIAITIGPLSIAAVILSVGLVASYMLGWMMYGEKISKRQGIASLVILTALILLQ